MPDPGEQDYCDWCDGPLSAASRAESSTIGIDREHAWACAECIRVGRVYASPPGGWDEDFLWPHLSERP